MVMPRTLGHPIGVSSGVYVHESLTKLEHILDNLYAAAYLAAEEGSE